MANMRAKHARLNAGSNVWGVEDSATRMLRSEAAKRGAKTRKARKLKIEAAKAAGKEKARARRERRAIERTRKLRDMLGKGMSLKCAAWTLGIGMATAEKLLEAS